jgi:hypothetical protein
MPCPPSGMQRSFVQGRSSAIAPYYPKEIIMSNHARHANTFDAVVDTARNLFPAIARQASAAETAWVADRMTTAQQASVSGDQARTGAH